MFRKTNKNRNRQLFRKIIFFFEERLELKKNKPSIIDLTQMPFVGPFVISLLVSSFWSSYPPCVIAFGICSALSNMIQ